MCTCMCVYARVGVCVCVPLCVCISMSLVVCVSLCSCKCGMEVDVSFLCMCLELVDPSCRDIRCDRNVWTQLNCKCYVSYIIITASTSSRYRILAICIMQGLISRYRILAVLRIILYMDGVDEIIIRGACCMCASWFKIDRAH